MLVEQRYRLGAKHHHTVMPLSQISKQLLFGGAERTTLPCINEGMEQNAVFDGGLTVAHLPEYIVVQHGERVERRLNVTRGRGDSGGEGDAGFLLKRSLVMIRTRCRNCS